MIFHDSWSGKPNDSKFLTWQSTVANCTLPLTKTVPKPFITSLQSKRKKPFNLALTIRESLSFLSKSWTTLHLCGIKYNFPVSLDWTMEVYLVWLIVFLKDLCLRMLMWEATSFLTEFYQEMESKYFVNWSEGSASYIYTWSLMSTMNSNVHQFPLQLN